MEFHQKFYVLNHLLFIFSVLIFSFSKTLLSTVSLNVFKSTGSVFNFPISKSSTFVLKLFRLVGTLTSLIISYLSTSDFIAIKCFYL